MLRNQVVLNYKNGTVEVAGQILSASTVIFEQCASETHLCSRSEQGTFVYLINLQHMSQDENLMLDDNREKIYRVVKEPALKGNELPKIMTSVEVITKNVSTTIEKGVCNTIANLVREGDKVLDETRAVTDKEDSAHEDNETRIIAIALVNDEVFRDALQAIARTLTLLNKCERRIVTDTILEFDDLFSDNPGCAKGYEHQLKLVTNPPSIRHTYPVPFHLREATKKSDR